MTRRSPEGAFGAADAVPRLDKDYVCPECGLTYWIRATCSGGFDSAECAPPHRRMVTVRQERRRPSGSP